MISKQHVEHLRECLESARVEPGYFIDGVVVIPESLARAWVQLADKAMLEYDRANEKEGERILLKSRVAELERLLQTAQTTMRTIEEGIGAVLPAVEALEEYDAVKMTAALEELRCMATRAYETGEPLIPSEIALKCKEALG